MLKDKNSNLTESLIRKYIVIYCEIRTVAYHWKLNWKRLVHKLGTYTLEISKKAGLSTIYTNHSCPATTVHLLAAVTVIFQIIS
jgi:hypothetical protein